MPRTTSPAQRPQGDPVVTMMSSLLPVHAALTEEWLVDAAATAAERALNAPFAFVLFEEQDGRLDGRAPASDLRRRSLQRVADAFGCDLTRRKIDPKESPHVTEALDGDATVETTAAEFFASFTGEEQAGAGASSLGLTHAVITPMQTAGERIGAMLVLLHEAPEHERLRLLAEHVACAAVNLRNSQSAREYGVTDAVRSVFDARKIETELQRELARAERYKREVSIAVVEATNLRLLREQYGRFLTDQLLQRLGAALAQNARGIDVIGAYKESGYTMILTEATHDGAPVAARRLLETAQETRIDSKVPGLELHLVAGWATCPADGNTSDALLAAAERRMYGDAAQVA